jgi:glycosyltransferase involved in cell wall biosynthesis
MEYEDHIMGYDKPGLLSVIVPMYNVEDYIEECLKSISEQDYENIEIIVINDGSTDKSLDIAESLSKIDSRISIYNYENQGLGPARNAGISQAKGEFICFVDSDDCVPARSYSYMLESLNNSNADFVSGNMQRKSKDAISPVGFYKELMAHDRFETHISRAPILLWDTVAWNKIFRKEFFVTKVGLFPNILYEDILPMCRAHFFARSVNILTRPIYQWRIREDGSSITQKRSEIRNLRDRMLVLNMVWHFLADHLPVALAEFERKVLTFDISIYLRAMTNGNSRYRIFALLSFQGLIQKFSRESVACLSAADRVLFALVVRGNIPEIMKYFAHIKDHRKSRAQRILDGRVYADLPHLTGRNALDPALFDVTDTISIRSQVYHADVDGDNFQVMGTLALKHFTASSINEPIFKLALKNLKTGVEVPLLAEIDPVQGDPRNRQKFQASIDAGVLIDRPDVGGPWRLIARVTAAGVQWETVVPVSPRYRGSATRHIGQYWMRCTQSSAGEFSFLGELGVAILTGFAFGDVQNVMLDFAFVPEVPIEGVLVDYPDGEQDMVPVQVEGSGWRLTIPTDRLLEKVAATFGDVTFRVRTREGRVYPIKFPHNIEEPAAYHPASDLSLRLMARSKGGVFIKARPFVAASAALPDAAG